MPNGRRTYVAILFSDLCHSTQLAAEIDADSYAELLETIRAALKRTPSDNVLARAEEHEELRRDVEDLDAWLSRGGFLPDAWSKSTAK